MAGDLTLLVDASSLLYRAFFSTPDSVRAPDGTPINGTFGVARLITAHERPQPVPAGVVEALLDYTDESGVLRFDRDLKIGQVVRVISGPFAKAIGQLDRLDANNRVKVLLNIMGGISATLDRAALQAA